MTHHPGLSGLVLKALALVVLAGAALLARSGVAPEAEKPAAGQALRAVGAVHPQISPDGKDVVFSYQGAVWRLPAQGGVMRRLAAGPGYAVEPCWSPDGKRIAFLQGKAWGSGEVKMIDSATGKALPAPASVLGIGKIAFSADGKQVLGNLRKVDMLDAFRALDLQSGELKTILRQRPPRQPWAPSADGKWLAYVLTMDQPEQQGGNDGPQADVWKMATPGGEPERIVRFPARIHDLCWSGDGKSLFASSELGGAHNDLWRIDLADPEKPAKLTQCQADEERPSVSADGKWLLHTDNHAGPPGLVLRDLAGGAPRTIAIERLDFGMPTGRIRLQVSEKGSKEPATARVAVEHADGSFHAPPGALWRVFGDHGHFYVSGSVDFEVPAGPYRVRAFRGPECRPIDIKVEVVAGKTAEPTLAFERWHDAAARGWYSGDNHIHANYGYGEYYNTPATMLQTCAGEDLNVGNFMVANSDGDGVFDREFFRGRPDPLSTARTVLYWNEEWRSTIWGHMTLVNLRQIVEPVYLGFKDTTNPYDVPTIVDISDRTRIQGGVVNFTHPSARPDDLYRGAYTAKGIPVYAALGKIDTMDAMGSNYPASSLLWHRLLNCGFRIGASAGTDVFLNRIRSNLPGGDRVYVKVPAPFSYARWIDGLRAGRSFVSNGPFVELSAAGKEIGDTIELAKGGAVRIKASALSQFPLDKVEVLHNGKVVASVLAAKDGPTTIDQDLIIDRSGWIALRALGPPRPETRGENLHAHTSPIYVSVAGQPTASAEDARYFLAWIDQLWATVQFRDRIPDAKRKAEVEAEIQQARAVYRKQLKE